MLGTSAITIYLYVKQHSITGLKYFGVTRNKHPWKYLGSGTYWTDHYRVHGWKPIKTIEVWGFDKQEDATEFALKFSEENNIVYSEEWANMVPENALPSTMQGQKHSDEAKRKISEASRNMSLESREKIGLALKGRKHTSESLLKMSLAKVGKKTSEETKLKLSAAHKGKKQTEDHKRKTSEFHKGRKRPPETGAKISAALKGKPLSEEAKKNLSLALKGKPQKRVMCPHCHKEGGQSAMTKSHFDNCKLKGIENVK